MRKVTKIDDLVPIKNVIISVNDKKNLDILIPGLIKYCPGVVIYTTDFNYPVIHQLMPREKTWNNLFSFGQLARNLEVGGTAMETLHSKVFLGLITKTYCFKHQEMIKNAQAISIDLAVINLRPIISETGPNDFESVSTRIDVAGQVALSAARSNPRQVMTLSSPDDYGAFLEEIKRFNGRTSFSSRLEMAKKASSYLKGYSSEVYYFLDGIQAEEAAACYEMQNTVEDFLAAEKAKEAEEGKKKKK
ncbi:MAG: hypothetical protein WC719_00735 [Patescibacteria group bacterium]|jgi:phosphoribosylaminoimidazolecarboxamide formyltransferase/IMP cyclohydrolase